MSRERYRVIQRTYDRTPFWCIQRVDPDAAQTRFLWFTGSWATVHEIATYLAHRDNIFPGLQWLDINQPPSPTVVAKRRQHLTLAAWDQEMEAAQA